jgi:hypothetical protein
MNPLFHKMYPYNPYKNILKLLEIASNIDDKGPILEI